MKLLFDFLPIVLFFIVFKLYGIYAATLIAIATSLIQVIAVWLKYRKIETMYLVTFVIILVLGTATLLFHDEMYIKWKPTVLYWLFSAVVLASQFIGQKPLAQRLMEKNISMSQRIWYKLNWSWTIFFFFLGTANLYVVYHFTTNTWAYFKIFGCLGLTLLFFIGQAIFVLSKHGTIVQKND